MQSGQRAGVTGAFGERSTPDSRGDGRGHSTATLTGHKRRGASDGCGRTETVASSSRRGGPEVIREFIVTRNGSLAWIGGGSCPSSDGLGTDGVYAIATGQGERQLVCGDPNSGSERRVFSRLRYAGGILTWQAADGQMSARLS